ncbi:MliC family protein [Palleronia sp. KMU-117]|uniref:MliC family protein n=1 Tax=Palleronia sp. KMU-117 TaxID=3434108 RepID=UPI003D762D87
MRSALAGLACLVAVPASAEVITARYLCERGVEIPVTYVNGEGIDPVAVLNIEGSQITLILERSASGARYGWPSGGSHYLWWTKGDAATLYWHDGSAGTETVLYSECVTRN